MCKLLTSCIFVICCLQGFLATDRNDIINEYQPILHEKFINLTNIYKLISTENGIIKNQLKSDTVSAITLMNDQITDLKTTITESKNQAENNTNILNCIAVQEAAVAKLNTNALNATCLGDPDYTDLDVSTKAIYTLSMIPNVTLSACTELDPLPSQDDLFLDCLTNKILDLDQQIGVLQTNFTETKTVMIQNNVNCLTQQSGIIVEQISEIHLQVVLCLSLG